MRKSLAVFPLLALLAACSGGSNTSTLPGITTQSGAHHSGGAARHTMSTTTINYILGSASYPSGYNPSCGTSLNIYQTNGFSTWGPPFSTGGGEEWVTYVGPCHAAAGDSMTAKLVDDYGHLTFPSHPSPGNFSINDTGQDSHAVLTVTDNTTGASITTDVWYSY
ncbi:MAG TPA: hypothetical protein VGX96_13940 [Candidatus Elarobacter sp.]|jgi:hypothetical protein|nr:hypothetical protein [Candidatus Elarobacter sp.]